MYGLRACCHFLLKLNDQSENQIEHGSSNINMFIDSVLLLLLLLLLLSLLCVNCQWRSRFCHQLCDHKLCMWDLQSGQSSQYPPQLDTGITIASILNGHYRDLHSLSIRMPQTWRCLYRTDESGTYNNNTSCEICLLSTLNLASAPNEFDLLHSAAPFEVC